MACLQGPAELDIDIDHVQSHGIGLDHGFDLAIIGRAILHHIGAGLGGEGGGSMHGLGILSRAPQDVKTRSRVCAALAMLVAAASARSVFFMFSSLRNFNA
jgi:hypothetical protein